VLLVPRPLPVLSADCACGLRPPRVAGV